MSAIAGSNTTGSSSSEVQSAARHHTIIFILYLVWLGIAALVSLGLTIALWKAGSKESELRIAESLRVAATAAGSAATANERAANLEHDNLALSGHVAGLRKAAADQQERAAKAEKALKEVANVAGEANQKAGEANERAASLEKVAADANVRAEALKLQNLEIAAKLEKERETRLDFEASQADRIVSYPLQSERLAQLAGTRVRISFSSIDGEAKLTASRIAEPLADAKWQVELREDDTPHLRQEGVFIAATNGRVLQASSELEGLLLANFIETWRVYVPHTKTDWYPPAGVGESDAIVWVMVGHKPQSYREIELTRELAGDKQADLLKAGYAELRKKMLRFRREWFPAMRNPQ